MTPVALEFLLHCYYDSRPYHKMSPAVKDSIIDFVRNDILVENTADPTGYKVTQKGQVWIESILKTPMPVQKWVSAT